MAKKYDPYKLPADEDINYGYSDANGKNTGSRGLHQITSATNANKLSSKLQKSAKMDGILDAKYTSESYIANKTPKSYSQADYKYTTDTKE